MLGQDLVVVMWRSGGSCPAMGHTIVRVEEGQEEVGELLAVEGGSEEMELVEPAPVYPVSVVVGVLSEIMHDFNEANHCCVRVEVVLNGKEEKGMLVQYRLEEQVKGARVSGNTGRKKGRSIMYNLYKLIIRWVSLDGCWQPHQLGVGCDGFHAGVLPFEKLAI